MRSVGHVWAHITGLRLPPSSLLSSSLWLGLGRRCRPVSSDLHGPARRCVYVHLVPRVILLCHRRRGDPCPGGSNLTAELPVQPLILSVIGG